MDNDELRTRVGVAHLLATYQFLADSGQTRQLAQLFAPDGVLEIDGAAYQGPDGVLEFFQGWRRRCPGSGPRPRCWVRRSSDSGCR
ncbi:MAG: hypothetical protein JWR37_82 [Mycobacterium sp.]|nr:hypothetical protein [Mycobacterium sp.]